MESLPWVFVLLRHNEINLYWLDSPELALQDNTIFVTSRHWLAICWIRHLGLYYFRKNSRNNGNQHKIKQQCLWNIPICEPRSAIWSRKRLARPTWNLSLLWQLQIDIVKFLRKMNEQVLKVSAPQSKSYFKTLKKNLMNGGIQILYLLHVWGLRRIPLEARYLPIWT